MWEGHLSKRPLHTHTQLAQLCRAQPTAPALVLLRGLHLLHHPAQGFGPSVVALDVEEGQRCALHPTLTPAAVAAAAGGARSACVGGGLYCCRLLLYCNVLKGVPLVSADRGQVEPEEAGGGQAVLWAGQL
jgi:hypothetical protein